MTKKKKTNIAMYMLLDALGGSEGLTNIFTAVLNSEQIPPALGQLGADETKTGEVHSTTSPSLALPSTLTTLLFEASCPLAVVPASTGALINIWCVSNPLGLYLESISDSRSRIYQEPDSWSRVIFRVGLTISSPYFGRWHPDSFTGGVPTMALCPRLCVFSSQAICWPSWYAYCEHAYVSYI
ncbi:hypothetical protein M405DRAFT_858159 [Rhizopogon salebrosus TDB-379]|nr:hypothetical protein M405DRAFT_858159 [Rhizopogon salebrosus TDB-379]